MIVGESGAGRVDVHPQVLTVIYLPEKVTKALASDKDSFVLMIQDEAVTVKPKPGATAAN